MNDIIYVYLAYTVIFLGIAIYIFYLHQKQSKLSRDIDILEEMVRSYGEREKERERKKSKSAKGTRKK